MTRPIDRVIYAVSLVGLLLLATEKWWRALL